MLELNDARVELTHMNIRLEKHGEDNVPATDLKFTLQMPAAWLDQISPGLTRSLYRDPGESGEQASLGEADGPTNVRHPDAKPWASTSKWPGYTAAVVIGEFSEADVGLGIVELKKLKCDPQEGGTVLASFTLSCYPQAGDIGNIYEALGTGMQLTMRPPAIDTAEEMTTEALNAAMGGED